MVYCCLYFELHKASSGETQTKKVLGFWKRSTFFAFCVRARMTLYDIRSQEHSSLLSILKGENETSSKGGFAEKIQSGFIFRPIREEHFLFFDQSEKSIVHLSPKSSVARLVVHNFIILPSLM